MRAAISTIPGVAFSFSQPIQCRIDELVAGTRAQLIVKVFGDDMDVLGRKADEIGAALRNVRGTADLVVERVGGQPYLTINIDRGKIARHGLNVSDVLRIIEISVGGKTATKFYEENRAFDVAVRYPAEYRSSVETIGNTLVPTRDGYNVPLSQLARIEVVQGPVQVSRENGLRRIGIEINIHDRDIGSYVAEAREVIRKKVTLPTGYYTTWGGQFENQQRAMAKLMIIAPIAVGLILLLLFITFKSIRLALLVIFNLPFALIGGVFALYVSGLYLSVPASVGFVVLFGVAVLNGVVLVSRIAQLREEGASVEEAVAKGSEDRLRPVLNDRLDSHLQPDSDALCHGSRIGGPAAARHRRGGGIVDFDIPDPRHLAYSVSLVRASQAGSRNLGGKAFPDLRSPIVARCRPKRESDKMEGGS